MKAFRGIAEGIWPYPGGRYTEKGWVWSRILEGILPQAVILTNRTTPASDKGRLIPLRLCGYPAKGARGLPSFSVRHSLRYGYEDFLYFFPDLH